MYFLSFKYKPLVFVVFYTFFHFCFISFDNSSAQEDNGAPGLLLRTGVGARAMSMGGAFVGLADDPSAIYWNPAGLYQMRDIQFEFMSMKLPFDRSFNFFGSVIPIKNLFNLGVGWVGLKVDDIEGRSANTQEPDNFFSSGQNAFLISISKKISPIMSIGGNLKIIRNSIDNISASGFGFDASLFLHPIEKLKLGLLVQNINTDYNWDMGYTEGVPLTYRIGAAYQIHQSLTVVADFDKTSNHASKYHIGGEMRPIHSVPIRVGLNNSQFSIGSGIAMPLSQYMLELNYAYSNDRIFNDAIHRLSLIFKVGNNSNQLKLDKKSIKSVNPRESQNLYNDKKVPVETVSKMYIVKANVLNVRAGPGRNYKQITQVQNGQKIQILDKKENWIKVKLQNGETGWVRENFKIGDWVKVYIKKVNEQEIYQLNSVIEAFQNIFQHNFLKRTVNKNDYAFAFKPKTLSELKKVLKVIKLTVGIDRMKIIII